MGYFVFSIKRTFVLNFNTIKLFTSKYSLNTIRYTRVRNLLLSAFFATFSLIKRKLIELYT